jgi:hypothetical protein
VKGMDLQIFTARLSVGMVILVPKEEHITTCLERDDDEMLLMPHLAKALDAKITFHKYKFDVVKDVSGPCTLRDIPRVLSRFGASSTQSDQYRIRCYLRSSIDRFRTARKRILKKYCQTRLDSQ